MHAATKTSKHQKKKKQQQQQKQKKTKNKHTQAKKQKGGGGGQAKQKGMNPKTKGTTNHTKPPERELMSLYHDLFLATSTTATPFHQQCHESTQNATTRVSPPSSPPGFQA